MREIKVYKVILHTVGHKEINGPNDGTGKNLWTQIYKLMDGEVAFVSPSFLERDKFAFLGLDTEKKNKELHWLIEQDEMIGRYSARDKFDQIWDSGEYTPEGCMYLEKQNVEIIGDLSESKKEEA